MLIFKLICFYASLQMVFYPLCLFEEIYISGWLALPFMSHNVLGLKEVADWKLELSTHRNCLINHFTRYYF